MCLKILLFNFLTNLSATIDFLSLFVEYISMLFFSKIFWKDYCKIHHLYQHLFYLVCVLWSLLCYFLRATPLNCLKLFKNTLTIVIPILSFKGATHTYLLNKSIAHNKDLIPSFYLLNDCISVKSTPQILQLNEE